MSYFELDFFRGEVQRQKGKKSMPVFGGVFNLLCTEFQKKTAFVIKWTCISALKAREGPSYPFSCFLVRGGICRQGVQRLEVFSHMPNEIPGIRGVFQGLYNYRLYSLLGQLIDRGF